MEARSPTVSVCIPVYNRAHQIGAALRSVLAQDFEDYEILVLDDGSTDGGPASQEWFADRRIRLETNGLNLGIPLSRNRCLELARGRYIAWLDSDDVMCPHRLLRQVRFLERHSEVATLGGWVRTFHDCGQPGKYLIRPLGHDQLRAWLLFRCCHANTTLMGRADLMRHFAYRESFDVSEDYDFSVRLSERYRVANLPAILTRQRQHEGRTTANCVSRCFDTKAGLATEQFARLGIPADAEDLVLHAALTRLRRDDVADPAFVDRAAEWLARLAAANRASQVLDERALADVLQFIWAQLCMKLGKVRGTAEALRRYRAFPVGGHVTRMFSQNLGAALGR